MSRRKTTEEFITSARNVWGDKFDYSEVEYVDGKTKVKIICPEHGAFYMTPRNHLISRHGCLKCGWDSLHHERKMSQEDFIERCHEVYGDKYDLSQVKYYNRSTKVTLICPEHGPFLMNLLGVNNHHGCPKCGIQKNIDTLSYTTEEFIERARQVHGDTYDYSKVEYKDNRTKVCIICPKHGEFWQVPHTHLAGVGCPTCKASRGEKIVRDFLEHNNIEFVEQKKFDDCKLEKCLPFDFYLPNHNTCIEYQGKQHYKDVYGWGGKAEYELRCKRDHIKRDYCKEKGILLLEIRYDENVNDKLDLFMKSQGNQK